MISDEEKLRISRAKLKADKTLQAALDKMDRITENFERNGRKNRLNSDGVRVRDENGRLINKQ